MLTCCDLHTCVGAQRETLARMHANTHWGQKQRHTDACADECWHTVTHTQTLGELKSVHIPHSYVPWLFSITATSLRWCICDIWRCLLYTWVVRYNSNRMEKERTSEKDEVAWDWGESRKGEWGKEHCVSQNWDTQPYKFIGKFIIT